VIKPYNDQNAGKKEQVATMFNKIAYRYDFLNHFLSLGIDKIWRRKAINYLKNSSPKRILDVASGTADLAIESLRLNPEKVIGIDISEEMLRIGIAKVERKGLQHKIRLQVGDSENLQFENDYFDAITVAFGVRNFENLEKGLSEMFRVLKPKGKVVILEFSNPQKFPVKQIYNFYFKQILPFVGKIVSKDKSAYSYLPESVIQFPDNQKFSLMLKEIGFVNCIVKQLSFGIASIYIAEK